MLTTAAVILVGLEYHCRDGFMLLVAGVLVIHNPALAWNVSSIFHIVLAISFKIKSPFVMQITMYPLSG